MFLVFLIYHFFSFFVRRKGKIDWFICEDLAWGESVEECWRVLVRVCLNRRGSPETSTLFTPPPPLKRCDFAVLCVCACVCVMWSISPRNQRLAPSTHTRTSVPENFRHLAFFAVTHHMVSYELLHTLPPLPVECNRKFLHPLCLVSNLCDSKSQILMKQRMTAAQKPLCCHHRSGTRCLYEVELILIVSWRMCELF